MRRLIQFCFLALFTFPLTASAQLQLSTGANTVTFTNFTGTGVVASPMAGQLDSDDWRITGMSNPSVTVFGGDYPLFDLARGASNGGVGTGGTYAFTTIAGAVGLGFQATGTDFSPGSAILRVQNNTTAPISSLTVSYTGHYLNDQNRSTTVIFGHSTVDDVMLYTDENATLFATPELQDALGWQDAGVTTITITPQSAIPVGGFYHLRWFSDDGLGGGSRDEIALIGVSIDVPVAVVCANDADCDDALFCSGTEVCNPTSPNADAMGCVPGTVVDPDDNIACTVDVCDEVNDVVTNTASDALCDDAMFCNGAETCVPADANADPVTGCVPGTPVVTDDAVVCTVDSCDEVNDVVVNAADDGLCDDNEVCTDDACDALLDCQFVPNGCSINNTCYADATVNPNNACEVCAVATDPNAWSPVAQDVECGAAMCMMNDLLPASLCDGAGTCVAQNVMACVNGCMNAMCNTPCVNDVDCAMGWCDAGMCSTANRAPVALIEPIDEDIMVDGNGGTFSIDGTGSSDPDGDTITFAWTIVSGGALTFDDDTSDNPTVTVPAGVSGDVEIGLVVNDGTVDSEQTIETVTILGDGGMDSDADMGINNSANNGSNNGGPENNVLGPTSRPGDDDGCCATTRPATPSTWWLLIGLLFGASRVRRRLR